MSKLNNKRGSLITAAIIVVIFLFVGIAEQVAPSSWDMLFMVLKKGAIYALIGVSMNLLNGFTGLFSLGQAGFMLLGAYTYGIFTIPVADRASVYQYFDGGLVQFTLPVPVALILAGLVAAVFAFLIGLPVLRLKSDYLAIATRLCGDHPRHFPVERAGPHYQRLQPAAEVPGVPFHHRLFPGGWHLRGSNPAADQFLLWQSL